MRLITKTITLALGLTVCSVSGYLLYLVFKRDEDDDYDFTYAKASKFKTLEIKVPKDAVRALIGRNGQNIKLIQEQSNTRINFKDKDGADFKICVIRGSVEACNIADNLIQEFINNQPVIECEDIWVPQTSVGKIIGRCGERITEIRIKSGAKLTIHNEEKSVDRRRISIKGSKEQILVAKSLVEEIVEESMQQQNKIENILSKREPRAPCKTPDSPKGVFGAPKEERLSPIPGQPDAQFEVYVSAMVDPSRFWVQIVGPKATELDCLVEEMSEYYGKIENRNLHVLDKVAKGDLVAAIFKYDSKWYRAEILSITDDEKEAELYYVDYGDTDTVLVRDLYELRTDFLRLHFQAIECYLARVDPVGGDWSSEAVDKFELWTHVAQWKKLSAKINGYTVRDKTRAKREGSPVPGVDLFNVNNEQDMDIALELVNNGYAVFKKDADVRSNSRTTSISNLSVASSS